ncbi:unnamed protein product [Euphydryas editha]|uniref:Cytochrome P450 n=1 Tax=Euphydryas editha TaxID=104508 RepID=A0AAU9UD71_EUPED|nr:unnamed protein product [Euphydryas editha]
MTILLLLALLLLYWSWVARRRYGEPPIASGSLPLIGHGHKIFGNSIQLWEKFKALTHECIQKGHAVYFLIGTKKFYVLTDPDDINLVSNICLQKDTMFAELSKELVGEGLIFADVMTWKRHRKLILPTFNQKVIESFLPIFNIQGRNLVKELEKKCGNGLFDSGSFFKQTALQTVCATTMGVEVDRDKALNFYRAYDLSIYRGIERFQKFWLQFDCIYNYTKMYKDKESCLKTVRALPEFVLSSKHKVFKLRNEKDVNNDKKEKNIFLDQLLSYSDELSEKEIFDEVRTMIVAGTDTSSNVLQFALILIGSYPNVQEKIFNELKNIFGDSNRDVEKNDLSELTYLEAVLKETMRYYVMAPFTARYIDKEIKLKNYTLQSGNNCFFSFYGVHRHEMWGKDADQFRPERWFENQLPSNPNAFIPFSIGKRNCIGRSFAMMFMKTILTHVLRRYTILADYTRLKIKLDVLIKPASGHYISIEHKMK